MLCSSLFFFFKQKTAYEMRISDWSSDVCSSDLPPTTRPALPPPISNRSLKVTLPNASLVVKLLLRVIVALIEFKTSTGVALGSRMLRSEEHTSELQSLMRISYAVFCLKKKNSKQQRDITTHI